MGDRGEARAPLTIRLEGPAMSEHRIALHDFVLLGQQLQTAVDRVARILSGRRMSRQPGPVPSGIRQHCSLEILGIDGGSVSILCDLPAQQQPSLFDDLGEETLATFVKGVQVIAGPREALPRGFDKGVLLALREAGKLLDHGVTKVTFDLQVRGRRLISSYDRAVHDRVVARIQGPVENRLVVEGRLLMGDFKAAGLRCRIHPPQGRPIACSFDETQKEAVLAALTRYVRIVGEAVEADGEIRLLKVGDLEILDHDEALDEQVPGGGAFFDSPMSLDALAAEQGVTPAADLDALRGDFWPEDESADEFIATVRAWRREGG